MSAVPPPPPPPPPSQPQPNASKTAKAVSPWFKKKRVLIPLAVFVLIGIATAGEGETNDAEPVAADGDTGTDTTTDAPVVSESTAPDEDQVEDDSDVLPAMGEPANDGQFEFVVNSLKCGATEVGDGMFSEETTGQFCMLDLTITNTGDDAQYLASDAQKLIDDQGREFDYAFDATFANDTDSPFLEEINPGLTLEVVFVFEVPTDANIIEAELHDSAFSGGVRVALAMS
jgi:hypothetical protein